MLTLSEHTILKIKSYIFLLLIWLRKKENLAIKIPKDEIRIVSKNTDKESRIEFLRRFLLADGMIAGFRNFGLEYIAKE